MESAEAREYLEDRFFVSPEAQLVHSLASRVIAQGLLNKGVTRENLLTLLTSGAGDAYYFSFLTEYHRRRLEEQVIRPTKLKSLHRSWTHIGTFRRVRVPVQGRLATEDLLSKRRGTGRLSYPLTANFSVLVQLEEGRIPDSGQFESQRATVSLHHREGKDWGPARPALDIAFDIRRRQDIPLPQVASRLAAWLAKERVELRYRPVRLAAGRALGAEEDAVRDALKSIADLSAFDPTRDPGRRRGAIMRLLARPKLPPVATGGRVLELPPTVVHSRAGKRLLGGLRNQAISQAEDPAADDQGASLEVAVAADQLLSADKCSDRILIIGATALASEGQPIVEWDVWRLDLIKGGDWRLVAVECSISSGAKKEEEDRAKLDRLWQALHKRFSDLCEYRTLFASAEDGELRYQDASRSFKRDP